MLLAVFFLAGEMTASQAMYFRFGERRKRLPAGVKNNA